MKDAPVLDEEGAICRVCGSSDLQVYEQLNGGFEAHIFWRVGRCRSCGSSSALFPIDTARDDSIYERVYRSARFISGYERYAGYARAVRRQPDPAAWLANAEDTYRWIFSSLAELQRTGNVSMESVVAEIGSGLGYTTFAIRQSFGLNCIGVDRSSEAVSRANQMFGPFFQTFEPTGIDVLISTEVIEHDASAAGFLQSVARNVSPEGHLIITTPLKPSGCDGSCWFTDLPPVHTMWVTEDGLRRAADAANLVVVASTTDGGMVEDRHHGDCAVAFKPRLTGSRPTLDNMKEVLHTRAARAKARIKRRGVGSSAGPKASWGLTLGMLLQKSSDI